MNYGKILTSSTSLFFYFLTKSLIETLTGSEGYGKFILRRLLTANAYLRENPEDHVIYFLVTAREVEKIEKLIRKNNRKKSEKAEQYIRKENMHFVTYRKVETLRKKLGIGKRTVRKA